MEKWAGDLWFGLTFVKPAILPTSFIDFLYDKLGDLRSRSLKGSVAKLLERERERECVP